ncbi:MAG: peptidoglycan editing factor PgeF [Stenotrophobium sp.]
MPTPTSTAGDAELPLLRPDWPAPTRVCAAVTTRSGGVSCGPYSSFNLGDHVGDQAQHVAQNRERLQLALGLPQQPVWLRQVHGTQVLQLPVTQNTAEADAACTVQPGVACAILTADCLPVLFCNRAGSVAAAAHAGWRGLLAGVLENTVDAMAVPPAGIMAWLGPAIGPEAFEVGAEVREAFVQRDAEADSAFRATAVPGKFMADLYALARLRLDAAGVTQVYGGGLCTHADPARFYSYRRQPVSGRMASLIWLRMNDA